MTNFDGDTYVPQRDKSRLTAQLDTVKGLMLDGNWRSLRDISNETGYPEASISARLRDLRKEKFGSYTVDRRHIKNGLYEYRVTS